MKSKFKLSKYSQSQVEQWKITATTHLALLHWPVMTKHMSMYKRIYSRRSLYTSFPWPQVPFSSSVLTWGKNCFLVCTAISLPRRLSPNECNQSRLISIVNCDAQSKQSHLISMQCRRRTLVALIRTRPGMLTPPLPPSSSIVSLELPMLLLMRSCLVTFEQHWPGGGAFFA